jgi:L-aminopeptidase/D-esterase-like protein
VERKGLQLLRTSEAEVQQRVRQTLCAPNVWSKGFMAWCCAGGIAFGLAAAQGVMEYLKNKGVGIDTHVARVPIVPAAAMFDLPVGQPYAYPTPAMGLEATR